MSNSSDAYDSKAILDRYPGIRPFEKNENILFFGREMEIDELIHLIKVHNVLVLFSNSGLGKSSLINAGLLPRLKIEYFYTIDIRFQDIGITIDAYIKNAVKSHIETLGGTVKVSTDNDLKEDLLEIATMLEKKHQKLLLIFDQFEEFFAHEEQEKTKIGRLFFDITKSAFSSIKLFFSIRADRMSFLNQLTPYIPDILRNCYQLLPLSILNAKQAIILPAQLDDSKHKMFKIKEYNYSDEAIKIILDVLGKDKNVIESSQLQIICQEMERIAGNVKKDDQGVIEPEDFNGKQGIIELQNKFYEKQLKLLKDDEDLNFGDDDILVIKRIIEDELLSRGKRVSQDEEKILEHLEIVKDKVLRPEIVDKSHFIIEKLLKLRLIRSEQTHLGIAYEISHDTLIDAILQSKKERKGNQQKIEEAEDFISEHYQNLSSSRPDLARKALLKAIAIYTAQQKFKELLNARILMSKVMEAESQRHEAKLFLDESLGIAESNDDYSLIGMVREGFASFYENENDRDKAYQFYMAALDSYKSAPERNYQVARLTEHLGGLNEDLYHKLQKEDKPSNNVDKVISNAYGFYTEAQQECIKSRDKFSEIRIVRSIERIEKYTKPWGFLLQIFDGVLHKLKGTTPIRIGRDVFNEETNTYWLKNEIGFPNQFRVVSRRHLSIHPNFTVEDNQSLNGTTVNTQPLPYGSPAIINEGDILVLANLIPLQFTFNQPKEWIPPPNYWAVIIDSATKKIHWLRNEDTTYSISVRSVIDEAGATQFDLSFSEDETEDAVIRFKFSGGAAHQQIRDKIMVSKDIKANTNVMAVWKIVSFIKDPADREFKYYVLQNSEEWLPAYQLPMQPSLMGSMGSESDEILAFAPSFQLLVKPELNPEVNKYF